MFTNTRLGPARIRLPFNAYIHDNDQAKPVTMRVTEIIIDVRLEIPSSTSRSRH